MDFKNVRHLREILITGGQCRPISRMQYSSQNASHVRPNFLDVPVDDQASARALYLRWGGHRREGMKIGMTVVIPMHSRPPRKTVLADAKRLGKDNGNSASSEFNPSGYDYA